MNSQTNIVENIVVNWKRSQNRKRRFEIYEMELLKRMKLKSPQVISGKHNMSLLRLKKSVTYSYLIQAFLV
jgi:hypothetical protein